MNRTRKKAELIAKNTKTAQAINWIDYEFINNGWPYS